LSTSLPPLPPSPPTIPLTPEIRAAYEDLYDKYEAEIEITTNLGVREALLASQTDVDDILSKDRMYRFDANTAALGELLTQIQGTNEDLVKLKAQIAAITSEISTAGEILAAINKVLTLVPVA
jgi:hypothetical protein